MAPSKTAKLEREKIIRPILDDATLLPELSSHLSTLRASSTLLADSHHEELDRRGTDLWNLATRLKRESNANSAANNNTNNKRLAVVRVFAFHLLDGAQQHGRLRHASGEIAFRTTVRLLKIANKAAKFCLDQEQVELCLMVLERAADYEDTLSMLVQKLGTDDNVLYQRLRVEYFEMRMALAWKQDRMDLAEVMFAKADVKHCALELAAAENFADLLFEIGKERLHRKDGHVAIKWFERAYDTLTAQESDRLSQDAVELRLSIMHHLVRALLASQTHGDRDRARDIIALLENDYGNKLVVSLLRLQFLSTETTFEVEPYYLVIHRMMRTVHLTGQNFKTIIHHIHVLHKHNAENACKALDDFLTLRLYAAENQEWIEKAFITRLWMSTNLQDSAGGLEAVQAVMTALALNLSKPLSAPATQAAQTLLWKRIDNDFKQDRYVVAEAWCRLLLGSIFEKADELNTAKILRKIILCSIHRQDSSTAREVFNQMSEAARSTPMTRYLMYKIALKDQDEALAAECIDIIARNPSKDTTILYACVLEAQQLGDKRQAIGALQRVLNKYNYAAPNGVHLPALLRCTARLLMSELSVEGGSTSTILDQVCDLFEGAASQASKALRDAKGHSTDLFNDIELEWFLKNSYNSALKYYSEASPQCIIRLLEACMNFMERMKSQAGAEPKLSLRPRHMICSSLASQVLLKLARAEDNLENQLQYYLRVRSHVRSFRQSLPQELQCEDKTTHESMMQLSRKLLTGDFEAAVHLKMWDDLSVIIEDSKALGDTCIHENLADMILASDAPPSIILTTLEQLTTVATTLATTPTLARWLRVLYQLSLTTGDKAISKTSLIISQACSLASRTANPDLNSVTDPGNCTTTSTVLPYPAEELEWLATTTFNRAIDAYCASDEVGCRQLAEDALMVAERMEDRGVLRNVLLRRYGMLRWEAEE